MSTERLIKNFVRYVSIDSESGNELEFCNFIENELKEVGFTVERSEIGHNFGSNGYNVHGYFPGEGESILVCCHMDTVCPGNGVKPIVKEDVITSDGTTVLGSDDKSGIAEIIETARILKETGAKHRPIEVMFTLSEETGLYGSKWAEYDKIKSKSCLVIDGEDVGEIVNTAAANLVYNFHITGRAAHAGISPESGIHALKAATRAIANIPVGHVDEISVSNVSNFISAGATNIVAPKADFDMEFRSFSEENVQKHIKNAIDAIQEACDFYGATFTYESDRHSTAFSVNADSSFIKDVCAAYERAGITPHLEKTLGGCDQSNIATHGIDTVCIGSGMRNVHTTSEYIKIKDMEDCVKFLVSLFTI